MIVAVVLPVLLLIAAVLVELAGRGVLRRNRIAGIRTRSTLRNDAAWVAGHRAASPVAWAGFGLSAVAGAGALMTAEPLSLVFATAVVVVTVATIAVSLVRAARAGAAVAAS